jgi:hypothetical protein
MKTWATSLTNLRMAGAGRLAAILTLALTGLAPNTVQAQTTCHTVLQDHLDWVFSQPDGPGTYYLNFAMVSNQNGLDATFAEGTLYSKFNLLGSMFVGSGTRYFSKQRWGVPDPNNLSNSFRQYPFNPDKADNVKLALNVTVNKATLYLSNATYNFDLNCDHLGVLYGFGNAQGPWNLVTPMFVISLKRGFEPPPVP